MRVRSLFSLPRTLKDSLQPTSHILSKPPHRLWSSKSRSSSLGSLGAIGRSLDQDSNKTDFPELDDYVSSQNETPRLPEHHLHIFAHKHNCHMTLTGPSYYVDGDNRPRRNVLLSYSSGNVGFRKAARGTYEATFQLGAYMMKKIKTEGHLKSIQRLEVIFRGFGQGREAAVKILTGMEGTEIRDKIIRVVDGTKLKHGGARSKNPRRL